MLELIVSPEADEDLVEIWLRIATDRDTETADRALDSFHQKFLKLLINPYLGRARAELAPYLRSIPQGKKRMSLSAFGSRNSDAKLKKALRRLIEGRGNHSTWKQSRRKEGQSSSKGKSKCLS